MTKTHDLKTVVVNHIAFNYFYTREKNDVNGNPRYRVFNIDPEVSSVYEIILKCYDFQIADRVRDHIENQIGVNVPF